MLGRLAKRLRAFGFDTVYDPSLDDHGVIACARARGAIALTRDTEFPQPPDVRILLVRDNYVAEQLKQVVEETPLDLTQARPLTRCTVCKEMLVAATRDDVWDRIPPFVYLTNETYSRCPGCGRVYWEGSHGSRLRAELARLSLAAGGDRGKA